MSVAELALEKIDPSPLNPRKTFDQSALDELAADIRSRGVLQNVVVRSKPRGRYELIVGERRYRAAKLATLETIPAAVSEMDDAQALETMIVENAKRADVDPIEEADAYRQLLETHRLAVDDIAAKVGKSRSAVYSRLKLCELGETGRKALQSGVITPSIALLVARIPGKKLQDEAIDQVGGGEYEGPMPTRKAVEYIQKHFMLRLSEAPWKMGDADLVPAAGSCSSCPKRTGNQAELFEDVKSADVCTDLPCFAKKRAAHEKRQFKELKGAGAKALSSAEAKKVIVKPHYAGGQPWIGHAAPYVDLDSKCFDDAKNRTFRKLLEPEPEEVTLAEAHGARFQLIPKSGLGARLKAAGHKFTTPSREESKSDAKYKADRLKEKNRKKIDQEVDRRVLLAIYSRGILDRTLGLMNPSLEALRFLAESWGSNLWQEGATFCSILGIEAKKHSEALAVVKWIQHKDRTRAELGGFLAMVATSDSHAWKEAEALLGFDRKTIAKGVRADVKRLAKPKRAKRSKAAKTKKKVAKKKARK